MRVVADVRDEELRTKAYWNGSITPGATSTTPLTEANQAGEVCVHDGIRTLVVESVPGEHRYGSNYRDDDGVRQYPVPGPDDLRVLHEWPGRECFTGLEPHFRWDGDQIVEFDPPEERRLDVPGWLAPHLVTVPFAIALVVAGAWTDRRRTGAWVQAA